MKSTLPLKLALVAGLGLTCAVATTYAPPAAAQTVVGVGLGVRIGPPPPRFERVPPPRRGYAWAPGYWRWDGHRHVWAGGYWVRARPGYRYHPAYWVQRGGEWRFHRGYWVR